MAKITDQTYRLLIGESGSGKTNSLLNLINQQPDIDKIYLHVKDLNDEKKIVGTKHINNFKGFIEYSNDIDNIY